MTVANGSAARASGPIQVSVVIPTRNRSHLIGVTLRSVLRQRDVVLEVIVVDDASSDDTVRVLGGLDDPRIRVVRHSEPRGPNSARNSGAREAHGMWLAFVDDDDVWAPDKLVAQLSAAHETERSWVYAGSVNVNERLEITHGSPPPTPAEAMAALPRYNAIPASASNVMIRRALFETESGFNESLRACEEWDLWLRLARAGPPACVRRPLVAYRMHAANATLDTRALVDGALTIERLHGTAIDWSRFHWWIAQLCVRRGRRAEACRYYFKAARSGAWREACLDLAALVRRRLRRALVPLAAPVRRSDTDWEDQARAWVEELRLAGAAERSEQ